MFTQRNLGITQKPMGPTGNLSWKGLGDAWSYPGACPGTPGCPGNTTPTGDLWNLPATDYGANPMYWPIPSGSGGAAAGTFWGQYGSMITLGAIGLFVLAILTGGRRR